MRGPIALFEEAWSIFNRNPRLFVSIYAPLGVAVVVAQLFAPKNYEYASGMEMVEVSELVMNPLYPLFMLVVFAVSLFVMLGLIKAVAAPETTTVATAFAESRTKFKGYFLLYLMVSAVVTIGFIFLIIPGVIALTWFGLAYFVYYFEGIRGVEAMKTSKALVHGHFMPVLGRMLAMTFAVVVAAMVTGFVAGFFSVSLAMPVLSSLANAVVVPMTVAYMYLMYVDLRRIKNSQTMFAATMSPVAAANAEPE